MILSSLQGFINGTDLDKDGKTTKQELFQVVDKIVADGKAAAPGNFFMFFFIFYFLVCLFSFKYSFVQIINLKLIAWWMEPSKKLFERLDRNKTGEISLEVIIISKTYNK